MSEPKGWVCTPSVKVAVLRDAIRKAEAHVAEMKRELARMEANSDE